MEVLKAGRNYESLNVSISALELKSKSKFHAFRLSWNIKLMRNLISLKNYSAMVDE